jgi:hypothetical protein
LISASNTYGQAGGGAMSQHQTTAKAKASEATDQIFAEENIVA